MADLNDNVTSPEIRIEDFAWLKGLETPYSWRSGTLLSPAEQLDIGSHLISRGEASLAKQREFSFKNFILQLVVGYELYASWDNSSVALSRLELLERELSKLDIISNNSLYRETRRAQWHVLLSSKACVLAFSNRSKESQAVIGDNFDPVSALTSIEVGGLQGIKSAVYLHYGSKAASEALRLAQEAVKASPRQAEWHLLVGRAMESLRRSKRNFTEVPEKELSHFERAVELSQEVHYPLHLARVYTTLVVEGLGRHGRNTTFNSTKLRQRLVALGNKAFQLYRKILQTEAQCTRTKMKCLEGMLKLPREFLKAEEMKVFIDEVTQTPNVSSNFYNVAGTYYLKVEKDPAAALRLFEQGESLRDYGCCINTLRLRVQQGSPLDVELCLVELAREFIHDPSSYEHALAHLGAFYVFREHNAGLAVDTINRIMAVNPRSKAMLAHRPMFLKSARPINMLAVVVNEMRRADTLPLVTPVHPRAQELLLRAVSIHHPSLLERKVDVHLVDNMLSASDLGKNDPLQQKY